MDFNYYRPIVEGVLNYTEDKKSKAWEEVVHIIFTMNKDPEMRKLSQFAKVFSASKLPTHFLISSSDVQPFVSKLNLDATLKSNPQSGFVQVENSWKMTFPAFRRLIFMHARHLIDAFEFIDNMVQMFRQYEIEMTGRSRHSTHWAIVEQYDGLIQEMQPHRDWSRSKKAKAAFNPIMDTQPRAFRIVHGSYETHMNRLDRHRKPGQTTYAPDYASDMYHSVLPSIDDEIQTVINYVQTKVVDPYVERQRTTKKVTQQVKMNDRYILINEEVGYNIKMLLDIIDGVRDGLRNGTLDPYVQDLNAKYAPPQSRAAKLGRRTPSTNYTSAEIFYNSNGEAFDMYGNVNIGPNAFWEASVKEEVDEMHKATPPAAPAPVRATRTSVPTPPAAPVRTTRTSVPTRTPRVSRSLMEDYMQLNDPGLTTEMGFEDEETKYSDDDLFADCDFASPTASSTRRAPVLSPLSYKSKLRSYQPKKEGRK